MNEHIKKLEAKFGLPSEVRFCKRCVISNQRPVSSVEFAHNKDSKKETIHLDDEGICSACRVKEKKQEINWAVREKELRQVCERFRRNDGSYDCIVPGSGGKDSFYAAHMLKYQFGMNPLTVTWAPNLYTDWGWKNFQAWIHSGFDNQLHTPNGRTHRLLTRLALENVFHPFQPFFLGQKSLAPKIAAALNIPLVFYGDNEAEYGNPIKTFDSARQDWKYFAQKDMSKIMISGVSLDELSKNYGLTQKDLAIYMPADPDSLEKAGVEVHYTSYYLKWHPQTCYYYAVENGGFQASPERTPGTYSKYVGLDDKMEDLYFFTYFIKFGIGRATYDAAQEIRSGEITRDEGVALVQRFDGEFPERFADDIFHYLSIDSKDFPAVYKNFKQPLMTRDSFMSLADQFRSPHLWVHAENEGWRLRHAVHHKETAPAFS